jgi:hypothetical protein
MRFDVEAEERRLADGAAVSRETFGGAVAGSRRRPAIDGVRCACGHGPVGAGTAEPKPERTCADGVVMCAAEGA